MEQKYDFLVQTARDLIKERYEKEGHHSVVAAALLTKDGKVYRALNTGTYQPSVATCAEIIAIGMAHTAQKDMKIEAIVAVRDPEAYVITPCGKCREYIADYSDDALVAVPVGKDDYTMVRVSELLPHKYAKRI